MADSHGADIDIATLRQDVAIEVAQLEGPFRTTLNEIVNTMCRPSSGGRTDGDGSVGLNPGVSAVGASLQGPSSTSAALLSRSLVLEPPSLADVVAGIMALGQPFGSHAVGALPPTSSSADHLAEGEIGAYAGLLGQVGTVGSVGAVGYGGVRGGAGATGTLSGPEGGLAVGARGGGGYGDAGGTGSLHHSVRTRTCERALGGPGGGVGYGGTLSGVGVPDALAPALDQVAHDRWGEPDVSQALHGIDAATPSKP